MDIIQSVRVSAKLLLVQMELYGQLALVEWQKEKNRLQHWLLASVLAAIFLLCSLLFAGVLVVALSWSTALRVPAIVALIVFYSLGFALCYFRCKHYTAQSANAFAATRAEVGADLALLRSLL